MQAISHAVQHTLCDIAVARVRRNTTSRHIFGCIKSVCHRNKLFVLPRDLVVIDKWSCWAGAETH